MRPMRSAHKALLAALLLSAAAAADPAGPSTAVLIARGDILELVASASPQLSLALSSPPAVTPWSSLPYLNVSFDFSRGGWSAALGFPSQRDAVASVPQQRALLFSALLPAGCPASCVTIGVQDSRGSSFGNCIAVAPRGQWVNLTVPLLTASFWASGSNLTLPITQLTLGVSNSGNDRGWLALADIALASDAPPASVPAPVFHELLQPAPGTAGVLVAGAPGAQPASLGGLLQNRLPVPCAVTAVVQLRNASGPAGGGEGGFGAWTTCATAPLTLPPWGSAALACSVDVAASPPSWLTTRSVFSASSCWGAADAARAPLVLEGALALVLPQPPLQPVARNVNAGVFGGQMLPTPAAAAAIGMRTDRVGPLWHWNQPSDCWNASTCFDWSFYDGIFDEAAAGIELMMDARELAPPWACARNDSGGAWSGIPGPEHYGDYQRWLTVMLGRYGPYCNSVEVGNEQDGYAYFASDALPLDYAVNLSAAMINITFAALAQTPNASTLPLMGLSSSMFDVGQEGNGGSSYLNYERQVLSRPGVMAKLSAFTFHTYAQGVWVPSLLQPWGNTTFWWPNQTAPGHNSTAAEVLIMARLLQDKAAEAGLPAPYVPALHPSEMGYNLLMDNAAGSGWTVMHGALIAQLLIHMRSQPLATYVRKAFLFAAYDGCCAESNGYFGIWRPAMLRSGANATDDRVQPTGWLPQVVPLAGAAAYATASALLDVPSGRLPGVFVVDHTGNSTFLPPFLPSCVAFESDPAASPRALPLLVLMMQGHHYNDAVACGLRVATAAPASALLLRNGVGTPMPVQLAEAQGAAAGGALALRLLVTPLPQYLTLPADASATAACASLTWT